MLSPFMRYAGASGAQVSAVADEDAAAEIIAHIANGGVRCTQTICSRYLGLCQALEKAGLTVEIAEEIAQHEPNRSALAAALAGGTGIVLAQAGIAETGSIILADDALAPRLLSMLAEVCVAILPSSAIVHDLEAAGALLADLNATGHRYVSLVTGPSRTADIERVLTIGVQGPKVLHIIVLAEDGVPDHDERSTKKRAT